MMMGRYQTGVDNAAAGIQPALVWLRVQRADFDDDAIANGGWRRWFASRRPGAR